MEGKKNNTEIKENGNGKHNSKVLYTLEKIIVPALIPITALLGVFVGNYLSLKQKNAELEKDKYILENRYKLDIVKTFKNELVSNDPNTRKRALIIVTSLDESIKRKLNLSMAYSFYDDDDNVRSLAGTIWGGIGKSSLFQPAKDQAIIKQVLKMAGAPLDGCYAVIASDKDIKKALTTVDKIRGKGYKGDFFIYQSPNGMYALTIGEFENRKISTSAIIQINQFLDKGISPRSFCSVDWGEPVWEDKKDEK